MPKKSAQKPSPNKPLHHTLREFLFSMSFWGSWTRSLLFFVMVAMMLALSLTGAEIASTSDGVWFATFSISSVILYSVIFFLYDATYVTLARRSNLHPQFDRLALFAAEAIAVISIFILRFVYAGNIDPSTVYIAIFAALLLLPIRAVLGFAGQRN